MSTSIFCVKEFETLPFGAKTTVARFNADDVVHIAEFSKTLGQFFEESALDYGTTFNCQCLQNIVKAVAANKIQAYFLIVAEEHRPPRFAGGAAQFATVFTRWNGKCFDHYPAVYFEDTYLFEEFRARPDSSQSRKWKGLGTFFRKARIESSITNKYEDAPFGRKAAALIGECSSNNIPSLVSLKKLGATIGAEQTPILVLDQLPPSVASAADIHVEPVNLAVGKPCEPLNNVFLVNWSGRKGQGISASFTEAISTFTGETVVRVQFSSNHLLPDDAELQSVLGAILSKANEMIIEKMWLSNNSNANALFSAMRIHAPDEFAIVAALKHMGAKPRILGSSPMLPVLIDYGLAVPSASVLELSGLSRQRAGAALKAVRAGAGASVRRSP